MFRVTKKKLKEVGNHLRGVLPPTRLHRVLQVPLRAWSETQFAFESLPNQLLDGVVPVFDNKESALTLTLTLTLNPNPNPNLNHNLNPNPNPNPNSNPNP
jgi:hypothetical protein